MTTRRTIAPAASESQPLLSLSHRRTVSKPCLRDNRTEALAGVSFVAEMMKPMLLSTAIVCAALTPPSRRPLAARSTTTSPRSRPALAAGASGPQRQILLVAAGVLAKSGRVLLQQRSDPPQLAGLWEFPGGKVDPGETLEKALARELDEELAITVEETDLEPIAFTCVEIRILRRVRAESSRRPPRHRRDACSMAYAPDALVDFHTARHS